MFICPATGHATDPEHADGPNCSQHGVPFFTHCPECGEPWPLVAKQNMWGDYDSGADFCASCATPAPWLSREELMAWIRNQVRASALSGAISRSTGLELEEILRRLAEMNPNDSNAVEGWKRLREALPKVWETVKPVASTVMGAAVKDWLGL